MTSRRQRILSYGLASAAGQAVSIACALATVPVLLRHLGQADYGHYAAYTSSIALTGTLDLGIGSGLITLIAQAEARQTRSDERAVIASALVILTGLGAAGLALTGVLNLVTAATAPETRSGLTVVGVFVSLSIPLNAGSRILIGRGRGWVTALPTALAPAAALVALLWAGSHGLIGHTVQALSVSLGMLLLGMAAVSVYCLATLPPDLRPDRRSVSRIHARRVVRSGGLFFVLGLAGVLGYNADTAIVSVLAGGAQAAQFSFANRLFSLAPFLVGLLLAPLWPAFAEALTARDGAWVRRVFYRAVVLATLVDVGWSALCLAFGGRVIDLWTGGRSGPPELALALGLTVWTVLNGLIAPVAMLLNGADVVRPQVYAALSMAGSNLALSVLLTRVIGVSGPAWGSVGSQLFFTFPITLWAARRVLATAPARIDLTDAAQELARARSSHD